MFGWTEQLEGEAHKEPIEAAARIRKSECVGTAQFDPLPEARGGCSSLGGLKHPVGNVYPADLPRDADSSCQFHNAVP